MSADPADTAQIGFNAKYAPTFIAIPATQFGGHRMAAPNTKSNIAWLVSTGGHGKAPKTCVCPPDKRGRKRERPGTTADSAYDLFVSGQVASDDAAGAGERRQFVRAFGDAPSARISSIAPSLMVKIRICRCAVFSPPKVVLPVTPAKS